MSSSAPKRRLDVRDPGTRRPAGKRAASRAKRRSNLRPTPAMLGAVALVVAGVGASVFSSHADGGALDANYQTISASYTGADGGTTSDVDISRDFDREELKRQAEQQAGELQIALSKDRDDVQAAAEELAKNQWVRPLAGYRLSARFGQRSSLWSSYHTGLDMSGPSGSTIVSIAAGTVKSTGYEGAYGNRTVITLLDGTDVWYCHQSRIVVAPGQKVQPGTIIGYTGSTGNVTGPHLHIEIHPGGGTAVDPIPVFLQHGVTL